MLVSVLIRSAVGAVLMALLLLLPAGRWDWPQAWAFIGLFIGCSVATSVWLWKAHPDLLAARMRSPLNGDQKPADRVIAALLIGGFAPWTIFMGFDARFGWSSPTPLWAEALGGALIAIAFLGWYRVLAANAFAATTIEVQGERGQSVISTGPYGVVRHPMYAFALIFFTGTPLLLGSLWGLAWLVYYAPVLMARSLGEEALLRAQLPGYDAYTQRVRYRFAPGLW